jgi:preprotein translocase subunit YajC
VDTLCWMGLGLLAAGGGGGGNAGGGGQDPLTFILTLVVPIGVLFYFFMIRPQRREQAARQSMLGAVKRNDRVVTIGGIHGVVTNIQQEVDEVTIKVDETTNTKLRMTLGSIARVITDSPRAEKD